MEKSGLDILKGSVNTFYVTAGLLFIEALVQHVQYEPLKNVGIIMSIFTALIGASGLVIGSVLVGADKQGSSLAKDTGLSD